MNGIRTRVALLGASRSPRARDRRGRSAPRPAAKNGGTLVVGLSAGEPDALDPTLARTFSGREVFLTFCEKLYDLNAKAQIVPQLATALPTISKDKLTVHDPAAQGDQVQRRYAVQRGGGRDVAPARPDAEGLGTRERDLAGRPRHRIGPVHRRHPPEDALLAADRAARRPRGHGHVADAADQARRELRHATRSASARSCTRTASPATASRSSSRRTTTTRRTSISTRSSSRSRTTPQQPLPR